MTTIILGLSIALQVATAGLAVRLIFVTRRLAAWTLITSAISLMAIRRIITLFRVLSGDAAIPPDMVAELVALAISILMFAGVAAIGPVFSALVRTRDQVVATNRELLVETAERRRAEAELRVHRDHLELVVDHRTHQIEEAKALAEAANRAKTMFLANMSHEVRTPLTAIIGFTDILGYEMIGPLNGKQREYVHHINRSGRHLMQLIDDILDVSKIEAGKTAVQRDWVDVRELTENCLRLIKERAHESGIEATVQLELETIRHYIDARKVRQVLFNILANALKFTPRGGRISLRAVGGNGSLLFEVADTGAGIKPEDRERIFIPFEQLDNAPEGADRGAGLGLSLSRKLVELHGGKLWVESEGPGCGSVFRFTIPSPTPTDVATTQAQ